MATNNTFDLIVIGGGVLGAFHAYHALGLGLKVALIEKDKAPQEATTRNFGQIVPSGMNSKWQAFGRESLLIYKELQSKFDLSVRQEGSIYLASDEEELQLIEELHHINKTNDYPSELMGKSSCLKKYPGLRKEYVKGGLFFKEEITVEPHLMIHRLLDYMCKKSGLVYYPSNQVISCENKGGKVEITTSGGKTINSEKAIICNGRDFKTLFPQLFEESGMKVSKIQMMQTKPQVSTYKLPGSILTGLSIRRYEAFGECPSFEGIKKREPTNSPEKMWGIHILFKQAKDGSIILGDSHQYADAKDSDDLGYGVNMDIDNYIIKEAKEIFDLPNYDISHRWFGMYSQSKFNDLFQVTIENNIHIVTGIGGKGMTGSAGYSKVNIQNIFNRSF